MLRDDRYEPQGYEPNDISDIHIETCSGCDFPLEECICTGSNNRREEDSLSWADGKRKKV